jgi:hypothetical protein
VPTTARLAALLLADYAQHADKRPDACLRVLLAAAPATGTALGLVDALLAEGERAAVWGVVDVVPLLLDVSTRGKRVAQEQREREVKAGAEAGPESDSKDDAEAEVNTEADAEAEADGEPMCSVDEACVAGVLADKCLTLLCKHHVDASAQLLLLQQQRSAAK